MNHVMLAKQYWNLYQNPNSLLARTYKAKYYPNCSLQEYTPKSHHSWCWKNIVKQGDFRLREGQWRVGSGFNIPLTHQNWFPSSLGNLLHLEIQTGTVGDLIDHNSKTWKADLVRTLYPFPLSKQILQIPFLKLTMCKTSCFGCSPMRLTVTTESKEPMRLLCRIPIPLEIFMETKMCGT